MRTVFRHYRMYRNSRYQPDRYRPYRDMIFAHYRRGKDRSGKRLASWEPLPKGGMTVCFIVNNDNTVTNMGVALCSLKDNFCYQTGRNKALDRAENGELLAWPSWAEDFVAAYGRGYTMSASLSDNGVRTLMAHHRRLNQREGS